MGRDIYALTIVGVAASREDFWKKLSEERRCSHRDCGQIGSQFCADHGSSMSVHVIEEPTPILHSLAAGLTAEVAWERLEKMLYACDPLLGRDDRSRHHALGFEIGRTDSIRGGSTNKVVALDFDKAVELTGELRLLLAPCGEIARRPIQIFTCLYAG